MFSKNTKELILNNINNNSSSAEKPEPQEKKDTTSSFFVELKGLIEFWNNITELERFDRPLKTNKQLILNFKGLRDRVTVVEIQNAIKRYLDRLKDTSTYNQKYNLETFLRKAKFSDTSVICFFDRDYQPPAIKPNDQIDVILECFRTYGLMRYDSDRETKVNRIIEQIGQATWGKINQLGGWFSVMSQVNVADHKQQKFRLAKILT